MANSSPEIKARSLIPHFIGPEMARAVQEGQAVFIPSKYFPGYYWRVTYNESPTLVSVDKDHYTWELRFCVDFTIPIPPGDQLISWILYFSSAEKDFLREANCRGWRTPKMRDLYHGVRLSLH